MTNQLTRTDVKKTYAKEKLDRAKALYFAGIYPTEISKSLKIPMDHLGLLVFGDTADGTARSCWHYQKEQQLLSGATVSPSEYKEVKSSYITQTEAKMMKFLNDTIDHHIKQQTKMNVFELEKFTAAIERLDKINRLEEGLATENVGVQLADYSQKEIIDYRRKHSPMMKSTVEAEFHRLKNMPYVDSSATPMENRPAPSPSKEDGSDPTDGDN